MGMADELELMAAAARGYFLEDKTKVEIGQELGMSRFKVARLLQRAREEGVVRISILDGVMREDRLPERLANHLGLKRVVVVHGFLDEVENRRALARAAAQFVQEEIRPGDTFGFSWGRTLAEIGGFMGALPPSTLVALTGTVGTDLESSPVEVLRQVAGRSQVQTMSIFAPLIVESDGVADALRREPAIASVLATYDQLSMVILSVGSWDPPITQLTGHLTPADRAELDRAGAQAEMVGIFVREDGAIIDTELARRRISITAEQLRQVPTSIAVAGGAAKVSAIAAVARSGLINTLITDETTARLLIQGTD